MARRRPHPARRTRRLLGVVCLVAYLAIGLVVAASERDDDELIVASPVEERSVERQTAESVGTEPPATFVSPASVDPAPVSVPVAEAISVPRPAVAPSVAVEAASPGATPTTTRSGSSGVQAVPTTTATPTTAPASTATTVPATTVPATTVPATTTTLPPLPTTTAPPATTVPPSTTIFIGGS